jgi:hypothetical protein
MVVNTTANSFAVHYADINKRFRPFPVFYTKARKNQLVKDRVGANILNKPFFEMLRPQLNDMLLTGAIPRTFETNNDPEILLMDRARLIIERNLAFFGVCPEHYYVPNLEEDQLVDSPRARGRKLYRDWYQLDASSVTVVHRYNDYNELYEDVLNETLTEKFRRARQTPRGAIHFAFPVNLKVNQREILSTTDLHTMLSTFMPKIAVGTQESGLLRHVEFPYVHEEDYARDTANNFALLSLPQWLVPYNPLHIDGVNFEWSDFEHRVIAKTGWKTHKPKDLFKFSVRQDV